MITTGDEKVDLVLEAGPRVFGPDLPKEVRVVIAHAKSLQPYRDALKLMAQNEVAEMHREIAFVSKQNREIESSEEFQARDGLGVPAYRIPAGVYFKMQDLYGAGCWKDKDFTEDFLKHHPGLRIKVTRGTRGQEYGGRSQKTPNAQRPTPNGRNAEGLPLATCHFRNENC